MDILTFTMGFCCIGAFILLVITVIQQKIENKKRKNSYYDFLRKL